MKRAALLAAVLVTGCVGKLDARWQLDHDRIVVIRATPPRIPVGGRAGLDGLVAVAGGMTAEAQPLAAEVSPTAPAALAGTVVHDAMGWAAIAPSEDVLVQARAQLGLADGVPVPLDVGLAFEGGAGEPLAALTTVYLDDNAVNPTLGPIMFNGETPTADQSLTMPYGQDTPMSIVEDPTTTMVNWLTSAGTMHDDNELASFIRIESDDATTGQLAVVIRDVHGGVAWQVWPLSTTGVPAKR